MIFPSSDVKFRLIFDPKLFYFSSEKKQKGVSGFFLGVNGY
ncbi:hypothetical protein NU08_0440 [Flavobacterium anhuiense]|uniref:Uncharacterized protein n=1 Tax=Flavobacterium anhuiense TaxID=459526 RepID=A0A444W5C4_9FLAO|nr:hypothetical protein NU08_0440 [Flavobacterium anhuiense]